MTLRILAVALLLAALAGCGDATPTEGGSKNSAAKISDTAMQVLAINVQKAVMIYRSQNSGWPASVDELVEAGILDDEQALDPWGNPWELREENGRIVVVSLGVDGKPGGSGADADHIFK